MQTQNHQSLSGSNLGTTPISVAPLTSRAPGEADASGITPQGSIAQDQKNEQELKLKFSEETHQYVREYIRLADQKATFFFAGATALLAYLSKLGMTNKWLANPKMWGLVDMLAFLATVGLILSAVACLVTVIPRLNGSRRGLIFFAAIREYESAPDYASEVMKQSQSALCEAKLRHTYELSIVCKEKYSVLCWGQWFGAAGVLATLFLLVIQ
ncbi:Pycsar system effector family protein [Limnobacter sp.]|uniref:Pycsar system effector family protein n=1 Tax=Limnobacter sp. TaxID=2003368 RepID=UPI0025BC0FE8|nr:Pycsar system effector family protein [Limnobacter sp.]